MPSRGCEFRGNRCSESRTSLKGINDILPVSSTLYVLSG
jgi:hypothetical protein